VSFRFMKGGNSSHVSELLYEQKDVCRNIVMLETELPNISQTCCTRKQQTGHGLLKHCSENIVIISVTQQENFKVYFA